MAERLLGVHGLQCHTGGDGSFAYDLDVQRGIVSGRVALLLRSAEIKPLLSGLYLIVTAHCRAKARECKIANHYDETLVEEWWRLMYHAEASSREVAVGQHNYFSKQTTTVRRFVCYHRSCRVQKIVVTRVTSSTIVVDGWLAVTHAEISKDEAKLAPKPGSRMKNRPKLAPDSGSVEWNRKRAR